MERFQFWIFLGLGLACGLALEFMKDPSPEAQSLTNAPGYRASAEDARPHYEITEKLKAPALKISGVKPITAEAPSQVAGLSGKTTKNVKKKADAKKNEDKKKKAKKNAQKKKKKVKGKKKVAQETYQPETSQDTEKKKSQSGDGMQAGGYGGHAYSGARRMNQTDPNKIPETVEEWLEYLLATPDFDRVSYFNKLYQSLVVDEEIAFAVIEGLLADERPKMREYAVLVLGTNPSPRSFVYLIGVQQEEQGASKLKSQVHIYLRTYTQTRYLRELAGAMSVLEDPNATAEALHLLQIATESHLAQGSLNPTPNPNPSPNPGNNQGSGGDVGQTRTPAAAELKRSFETFVPVLTRLAQTSADASIRDSASQALSRLQSALGLTT